MKLRLPQILRRQYLNRSPIWRTYIANPAQNKIPEQLFKINTKLYSAYTLSQVLRANTNNTSVLIEKFNKYCQDKRYGDDFQNLEKVRAFLRIVGLRGTDRKQYLQKVVNIYDVILDKYGEQHRNKYEEEVQAIFRKTGKYSTPPPPISFTPISLYQKYLHTISTISNVNALDDIDLLILTTTQPSVFHMDVLNKLKIDWAEKDQSWVLAVGMFRDWVLRNVCRGGWDDVGTLGIMLPRFRNAISNYRKKMEAQDIDIEIERQNLFLQSLDKLIVEHKSPTFGTLQQLNKPLPSNYAHSTYNTYLECFINQYLLYLDWLSIRCLYQPTQEQLVIALQEYVQCCSLLNLGQIHKNMEDSLTKQEFAAQLKHQGIQLQLVKLEITSNLYDQITNNLKISGEISKNINNLRTLLLNLHKQSDKLSKLRSKQTLQKCIRSIKLIQSVINFNNCNINLSPDCVNQFLGVNSKRVRRVISNGLIIKLSQMFVERMVQFDVILLTKDNAQSVYRVIQDMVTRNGKLNHKVNQYYKKLQKYISKHTEAKLLEDQNGTVGNRIGSLSEANYLWEILTGKVKDMKNQNTAQVEEMRKNILILQNIKDHKSQQQQPQEHTDNILLQKIHEFFTKPNQQQNNKKQKEQ